MVVFDQVPNLFRRSWFLLNNVFQATAKRKVSQMSNVQMDNAAIFVTAVVLRVAAIIFQALEAPAEAGSCCLF